MDWISLLINGTISAIQTPIAAVGNIIVFTTILKTRSLQTKNNYLILQLCVCDLFRGSILAAIKASNQLRKVVYQQVYVCQINGVISCLSYLQSPATLMIIAVLHYKCIVKSKYNKRFFTRKRIFAYGLCALAVNFVVAILPVLGVGEYKYSTAHGMCFTDWSPKQIIFRSFFYILTFGVYYPPIVYCYLRIFMSIKKHNRDIGPKADSPRNKKLQVSGLNQSEGEKEEKQGNSDTSQETRKSEFTGENEERRSQIRRFPSKYETDVTMVMFAIVVAYFICWFPAFFLTMVSASGNSVPSYLEDTFITLIDIKALLNPFIYAFQSRHFRRAFMALLVKKKRPSR